MAQVKLAFKSIAGAKMVVTRSIQLTVKKASTTQKTLECQLLMIKDGERTTISSRVAELDSILPQYLGVSDAILDNVIFCHQDESLWPMSEPGALKKKFDEIFEAMKYTNAIKNIKDLRKNQNIELGKLKIREENEKINKDRGERAQRKSEALSGQIEELRQQVEKLDRNINSTLQTSKEKHLQATKALGIVEELKTKAQRAHNLQENIDNLKPNLEELRESDEWLQSTLEQYEGRMLQYQQQEADFQAHYQELQKTLSNSRQQLSNKQAEKGQCQAEKDSYERQIQYRGRLVKEAANRHALRGYDGDLDEDQIREFIERVRKLSREKDRELERLKKATDDELRQTQALLTELDNRKSVRTQDKSVAKQTIADNDKKLSAKQSEVNAIGMDEGAKSALEASRVDAEDRLSRMSLEYERAEWDKNLQVENNGVWELENESERLRNELFQSNKLAKDRAELEYNKKELKDRQRSLETMKSTYGDQLSSALGAEWQWDSLEREFQTILDQRAQTVANAKMQQEGTNRELRELDFRLKSSRATLNKKKENLQKCQTAVLNSIISPEGKPLASTDDYLAELEVLETECNKAQTDLDGMKYVADYYNKCLETANHHNACRLCERPFVDKRERSLALEKINRELAKYARQTLEEELETLKQELSTASAARPQYQTYKTLSSEISALEEDIKKAESEKSTLVVRLESRDMTVNQEESAKRDVEALSKTVSTITRYGSEILKHEANISRLSSQQKLSGSSLTLEEIEEQHTACDDRLRSLKSKINKMTNDKDQARSKINSLEAELGSLSNKLSTAGHLLEKKQGLLSDIEDLRTSTIQLRDAIQRADADLESLVPQFAKATTQHEDARQRGRAKEKEIQSDKDRLATTVNKFKLVEDDITRYVERGGPESLATCQRAIKALEQDQKRIDIEILEVTKVANDLKKRMDDSERTKRSIIDNLQYRKNLRALDYVQQEIAELTSRNVTDDYEQLKREAVNADKRYNVLSAEKGSILGSMKAKDEELVKNLQEWETDFQEAAQKYREAHIKVETTKAAIDDLGKYSSALDAAIMKYHSLKMEEINRIAGELWQSTYQGTDVDTIMIRSENENEKSKRSYNYRVVMVKQDAEMDMRGRCSAGQKVLASIIIRLALAECFGVNCGIIALDEPTTNLDSDNIKALAQSLHSIIKTRRQQSNFQLIVITHDEEFLKEMKCQEFCENYYRVSRNEKQKSSIEMQSISQVIG